LEKGMKRTTIARGAAGLSCVCGVIGLLAGLTGHTWKLGPQGWFVGGTLLTLIALFILVDRWVAFERHRIIVVPKS
jgi:hypothetical protein